uniref:Major facilitator superfamily (MFS) profile domain-containing protein n=1 Tax=Anopheles dirus TaxID=7168 RepID=A0A182N761_9DIPT
MEPSKDKSSKAIEINEPADVTTGDGMGAPADFETAIGATGYGRFNYILLLVAMPCCMTTVFETTTMSYVLPSAECDLNLTLADKGMLNAITYTGMITSAFLWGFLSDTYGRKRLLVVGFLLDSTFNVLCALSQNLVAIMVFKFMGGFVICGPFAVLMAYLSEFHSLQHRSRVMIVLGVFYSAANMLLPALAWLIIPQSWNLVIGNGVLGKYAAGIFEIHSWQIFLAVSCLPGVLSGISVMFLPESPKFLMSKGQNERAMAIFRRLHAINTGSHQEFPIKELVDELRQGSDIETPSGKQAPGKPEPGVRASGGLGEGFRQLGVMFRKPHLKNACLAYGIQFGILLGLNTFRLWVPQLFTIIEEFEHEQHLGAAAADGQATLCEMLAYKVNKTVQMQQQWLERDVSRALHGPEPVAVDPLDDVLKCTAIRKALEVRLASFYLYMLLLVSDITGTGHRAAPFSQTTEGRVYLYSLIIGCVGIGAYAVTTVMINSIGNRNILTYGLLLAGCSGTALYWARSSLVTLVLSSCYITVCSIASTALVGAVVAMFPTSMRSVTMVVSLTMMCGRTGSIIGNVVFPYLMALGCLPPFVMIGAIVIAVAMVSRFLPRTVKKPLQ